MILKAPAKINIGLRIINKREDGFHNLETIFYPVSLCDEISIKISPSKRNTNSVFISSGNKVVPQGRNNICFKMIEAFFVGFNIKEYYTIELSINKKIPVGGGLGGGSSDAAAVLKFLVRYFNINVTEKKDEILNTALKAGSDVPFFLILKPCFARSRGEIISRLEKFDLSGYKILLVNPNLHISTKWAFENLEMQYGVINESGLKDVKEFSPDNLHLLKNDFEGVVFNKYIELEKIKNELYDYGAVYSSLSGSGATMFGIFNNTEIQSVKEAYNSFKTKNYFVYIS
jgi:4-diphosphocytidyl-2-C-methyl-D-erythritol kinase